MTGWKRSLRLPAHLTRWINTLYTALHSWSWPFRRVYDAYPALYRARRCPRLPVRVCLEDLEDRQMLDAGLGGQAESALRDDLGHLGNDLAKSNEDLVNAVQSSPINRTPLLSVANQVNKVESELTTDLFQTEQAFVQVAYDDLEADAQALVRLLSALTASLSGQAPSLSPPAAMLASPPAAAPSAPLASRSLFSPNSDLGGSSSVSATISLHKVGSNANFQASVHGSIGGGIFTFTGSVTIARGTTGIANDGDAVSGTISGFSGDSFSGSNNFNMTDETSGSSFDNGGASGSISGSSLSGVIGGTSGLPNAQGPAGSQWGGFINGTVTTTPLSVTNPGNQSNAEGDNISLQMQASGGSGSLFYGASGLPAGLTIDSSTGLISGTLDYTDAETQGGQYSVTVNVLDSNGDSASTTFNWTVTDTDTPPTLDNPGDQTNWQGDAEALQLSASDPDGDNVTYSATGLPGGLSLNSATGLISGVLAAPDAASSPYSVTVNASDGHNQVSQSFTWTVTTVQIDPIADQTNLIGDNVSVTVNAYDQSGQSLSYNATGLPPGLSINSSTGLISGTIASNASVTTPYNVTVTASDGSGAASTSFAWNLSNFTLDNPGDQSNAEGDAVALQLSTESNGNPTLTYSASGLPSGLSINPNTGLIAGTIANLDSNSSPYSVSVSDRRHFDF